MFESPLKAASLMNGFEPDWFVAGGWAIDLFLGNQTRAHADIEIAIFRRDQLALQKHLGGWRLRKAVDGALFDWAENEFLQLPLHEINCFNPTGELPFLEVLLNETTGADWIFRRDDRVGKPLAQMFSETRAGIRFLPPEIVLLYKSKNPREKDELDFQNAVRKLDRQSRKWLKDSLSIVSAQHHWLENL